MKLFFYRNNSLVKTASTKPSIAKLERQASKECLTANIRIEYWTYESLVEAYGQGNAARLWSY